MERKIRIGFLLVIASFVVLTTLYHKYLFAHPISPDYLRQPPPSISPQDSFVNYAIAEHHVTRQSGRRYSSVSSDPPIISTVSILLPAWEVLVVVSPSTTPSLSVSVDYACLFADDLVSPARPAGSLPFTDQATFKCVLPTKSRHRLPFLQPVLVKSPVESPPERVSPTPELLRWSYLAYESLTTEKDVVVFVKGLNNRQGINRAPSEFRCVFGDDAINGVRTTVTHSLQEVFRCERPPHLTADESESGDGIKISLEIVSENRVIPSVAYYTPPRRIVDKDEPKSLLCACTMVYNVAKFLKEWVVYHSSVGVERFILYDNDSDDDLKSVVDELILNGYNVTTLLWLWPKTQEAGFSHCAMYARETCRWMTYIDVDEFVYSPSWLNASQPSNNMLRSLLPNGGASSSKIGQVMMSCYEFGPSNQNGHPVEGVTQGYNCRSRVENRHKSMVLVEAIDESLINAIHHFKLKEGYRGKKVRSERGVVNHYKYQAWSEFKNKFRRRVSAYVVDWTQAVNPSSKDRTPGLGYAVVEPLGWSRKFCEVYDNQLRDLTRRWFGSSDHQFSSGFRLAWQS